MQVQSYNQSDLKRIVRKIKPGQKLMPEMGLGQCVGTTTLMSDQYVQQAGMPVTSGLTQWYAEQALFSNPVDGAVTASNSTHAASTPSYIEAEAPDSGLGKKITAVNAGAGFAHGITRTTTAVTGQEMKLRVWVRKDPTLSVDWCYLQHNFGAERIWFNMATGNFGTVTLSAGSASVQGRVISPTDGLSWWLLVVEGFFYSAGTTGLFMATADNTIAFDFAVTGAVAMHYESLQCFQPKVQTWTEKVSAGVSSNLIQATLVNQPSWRASSDKVQGAAAVRFNSNHSLADATAATWASLHDGTGSSFAIAFRNKTSTSDATWRNIFTTNGGSSSATGVAFSYKGDTRQVRWEVGGAGSNKFALDIIFADAAATLRTHWIGASLASVDNPDARFFLDGVQVGGTNPSGSFTAGAPTSALTMGGTNSFDGDIPELLFWNRALTPTEWSLMNYYFQGRYGTG